MHKDVLEKTISESYSECSDFGSDEATCDGEPVLPLKEEVRVGDLSAVREALSDKSLDPSARDDDYTLLHWASSHTDLCHLEDEGLIADNIADRREIVEDLLKRGANPNVIWLQEDFSGEQHPMTPRDLTEDQEVIRMLCEASICWGLTVDDSVSVYDRLNHLRIGLVSAATLGQTKDADSLWRLGADANDATFGITALGVAVEFGHLETVEMLVRNLGSQVNISFDDGQTALYCAVYHGYKEIVEFLLQHDANPLQQTVHFGGMSSWACAACLDGREKQDIDMAVRCGIIESILAASVKMVKKNVSEYTTNGANDWKEYTWVFMECIRHGYMDGMDSLLENSTFELPPTCLQLATAVGNHTVLLYLLQAGALCTYNGNWEEERWHGPELVRPSMESIEKCKESLSHSLEFSLVRNGTLKDTICY
jgi:ankyrin repeat protein